MDIEDNDPRPIILVTTVDIGEGLSGKIELREGDDPVSAAREFCLQWGLPDAIVGPLSLHICENIERSLEGSPQASNDSIHECEDPDSPSLDTYLPDDSNSPCASNTKQQEVHQVAEQLSQLSYPELDFEPAAIPLYAGRTHSTETHGSRQGTDDDQRVQSNQADGIQQRPASAPHVQADLVAKRAIGSARPASTNSSYAMVPPSSISSGSSGGRPYAHDRLYADYFSKQSRLDEERRLRDLSVQLQMQQVHVTPVSQLLASQRNSAGYNNYGERLYVEGRLEAMRKEKEAERIKQQEEEEELSQCAFRPEISKMARTLKAVDNDVGAGAAWQRLYQRGQLAAKRQVGGVSLATAERMESIRKEQEEEEVRECTFRPQLNSKSLKMVRDRQAILKESGISGYEQLFNDSLRRQMKQQYKARQAPEDVTFRPRINKSSVVLKKLMSQQAEGDVSKVGGDVATRLIQRGKKYQEKLQHARGVLHGNVDPSTGKPLYKPQTCRAPKFSRNPDGQPIGEYLYSIQQERAEKMSQVLSSTQQQQSANANSTFVNKRSQKMVEKLKQERFRSIFDYLGREQAGLVINLIETVQDELFMDTIDSEVRADIEYAAKLLSRYIAKRDAGLHDSADSVAEQPQYAGSICGEVDEAGFHALMEDVLQRTSGISRQYLLPMPATRRKFDEPTFQPAIDPNSKVIAARRRPENLPAYEVLYKIAEETEHKRWQKKKLLEMAELEECIFNPKLEAKQLVKEGRALKMAANLTNADQESEHDSTLGRSPKPGAGQVQDDLQQFDHIERQIQDALVRLSMNGDAMAALAASQKDGMGAVNTSLDCSALFGSPNLEYAPPASSLGNFSPNCAGESSPEPARRTTLEWCESGDDFVANIINKGEGEAFDQLDLHAIASASIEVPSGGLAEHVAPQAIHNHISPSPASSAVEKV